MPADTLNATKSTPIKLRMIDFESTV